MFLSVPTFWACSLKHAIDTDNAEIIYSDKRFSVKHLTNSCIIDLQNVARCPKNVVITSHFAIFLLLTMAN